MAAAAARIAGMPCAHALVNTYESFGSRSPDYRYFWEDWFLQENINIVGTSRYPSMSLNISSKTSYNDERTTRRWMIRVKYLSTLRLEMTLIVDTQIYVILYVCIRFKFIITCMNNNNNNNKKLSTINHLNI